jgi:hypothetical protein
MCVSLRTSHRGPLSKKFRAKRPALQLYHVLRPPQPCNKPWINCKTRKTKRPMSWDPRALAQLSTKLPLCCRRKHLLYALLLWLTDPKLSRLAKQMSRAKFKHLASYTPFYTTMNAKNPVRRPQATIRATCTRHDKSLLRRYLFHWRINSPFRNNSQTKPS